MYTIPCVVVIISTNISYTKYSDITYKFVISAIINEAINCTHTQYLFLSYKNIFIHYY